MFYHVPISTESSFPYVILRMLSQPSAREKLIRREKIAHCLNSGESGITRTRRVCR
jgi:hypothetical protein